MQEANSFNENKQILIHFYNLLIESNIYMPNSEILEDLKLNPDPEVEEGLQLIKQYRFKANINAKKDKYNYALEKLDQLQRLLSGNLDKLISTLENKRENEQLVALFRKYEELSEKDKAKMLEDKYLLSLLRTLESDDIKDNDNASQ